MRKLELTQNQISKAVYHKIQNLIFSKYDLELWRKKNSGNDIASLKVTNIEQSHFKLKRKEKSVFSILLYRKKTSCDKRYKFVQVNNMGRLRWLEAKKLLNY